MTEPSAHISMRKPMIRLWLVIRVIRAMEWMRMPNLATRFGNLFLHHLYVRVRADDGPWTKHRLSDFGSLERTEEGES